MPRANKFDKSKLPSRHTTVGPERAPHRALPSSLSRASSTSPTSRDEERITMVARNPRRKTATQKGLGRLLDNAEKELSKLGRAADKDLSRLIKAARKELVKTIRTAEKELSKLATSLEKTGPRAKAARKKAALKKAREKKKRDAMKVVKRRAP